MHFDFVKEEMKAVGAFKDKPIKPSVLALPRIDRQKAIAVEPCDTEVRCLHQQNQGNENLKLTVYWLKPLCDAGNLCNTTYKTCLAVIQAALFLRPGLGGSRSMSRMNHQAL